jgi:hypothetical protein
MAKTNFPLKRSDTPKLITLGDYRRAAMASIFTPTIWPEKGNFSPYDAIETALVYSKELIIFSRCKPEIEFVWDAVFFSQTEYEIRNLQLFHCIKLMEFAITYTHSERKSIEKFFESWPKRPDVNAKVLTSAGLSYLAATFKFVRELGNDITHILQNAYKEYKKEGNIIYWDPLRFINETPQINDLIISPKPDIIIKTWFNNIMEGMQKGFPESEFSDIKMRGEFNSIQQQLDYEKNQAGKAKDHLITLRVAVKNYDVSRVTLKRHIKNGELNFTKKGNLLYVDAVEVSKNWNLRKSSIANDY